MPDFTVVDITEHVPDSPPPGEGLHDDPVLSLPHLLAVPRGPDVQPDRPAGAGAAAVPDDEAPGPGLQDGVALEGETQGGGGGGGPNARDQQGPPGEPPTRPCCQTFHHNHQGDGSMVTSW